MGKTAQKLEYLGTTKSQLKDMINYGLDEDNKITSSTTFRNYVSSIFNAFLEALRNPDTLFTNLPKKSGTGANITLNGTANAPMKIELEPSELSQSGTPTPSSPQDIHTISGSNTIKVNGKNLLNNSTMTAYSTNINSVVNGVITTNSLNNWNVCTLNIDNIKLQPNVDYYCTAKVKIVSGSGALNYVGLLYDGVNYTSQWSITNPALTSEYQTYCWKIKTTENNYTGTKFLFQVGNVNNLVISLKDIIFSQTANDSYEPYTSQEADIDLGVQNLIKEKGLTSTGSWTKWENTFTLKATGTYNYCIYEIGDLSNYVGKTLTFSFDNEPSANYRYCGFMACDSDGSNRTELGNVGATSNTKTLTIPSGYSQTKLGIRLYLENLTSGDTYQMTGVQVIEGSTYQKASYNPIQYCKIGNYEDKFIRNSGKNIIGLDGNQYKVDIKAGDKITVRNETANSLTLNLYTNYGDTNRNDFWTFNANETRTVTIAYNSNAIAWSSNTIPVGIAWANYGDTLLPYEPYGSNEWYIKKNIGKVVLDGSENWGLHNSNTSRRVYKTLLTNISNYSTTSTAPLLLLNYFVSVSNNKTWTPGDACQEVNGSQLYLTVDTTLTDVNTFKTWLGTHNTIVYYVLATPTYTQITGTLAEQLENVYQKMLSYSGQTNISQVNNDLSFVINASALEDLS